LARKILLADDSVTAQNMGRKILADAGYEVITVNNGSAALKKIGEAKPDLIVLDVYMPGYSGLEVCQRLKEVADTSRIPILLTVGKLEPFKPEEAKRVRADAFIVKPFEASELLSALSKLEDKVVPRADSSKPGRFARATAAIEESRYDKTMAVEDDDSGWKSRISFPKKKKEKPPEQEVETGEIYNAVNKDLRTTVANKPDHKVDEPAPVASPASHPPEVHAEEPQVNLAALAPEGLPKDVTAEEIAALAAAAAQIKGKVVDGQPAPSVAETPAIVETAQSETVAIAKTEPIASAEVHETSKEETRLAEPAPVPESAASAPPATLAAQDTQEKTEEKKPEHKSGPAEVMAAIAGLETEWISLPAAGLGNPITDRSQESAEPVTMAVAANAGASAPAQAHWSAVAVAVAPEEASISLEQEMQKACAAFAAAETGHAVAQVSEPTPAVPEATTTAVAETPAAQPVAAEAAAAIPATSAPEAVQSLSAVSEAATDAVTAAVKELEAVAAKYEAEQKAATSEPRDEKSVKAEALESPAVASAPEPKIEESVEAKTAEKAEFAVVEPPVEARTEEAKPEEIKLEETKTQELKAPEIDPPQGIEAASAAEALAPQIASEEIPPEVPAESEKPAPAIEVPEAVAKQELSDEQSSSENVSGEPAPVSKASPAGGMDDMAKRESETAAAWATWRKIRETGGPKSAQSSETSEKESAESLPRDRAAMAVAAGAEGKPEEATNFDADPEIASIVDSVLADMRPKIVEEIARKLGKKK
jgi:twitching motility two-component system response regulator PilH